ncbi:MAG: GNAT family N-acetyltransferase [Rhodoblastus sp.]
MLNVTVFRDLKEVEALFPEWEKLVQDCELRLPFQTPEWVTNWWRHFRRDGFLVKDQLQLFALRDPDGALVAVAPMMLTLRPGIGPIKTRELQFIGADNNITEIRGPICHPARLQEAFAALRAHVSGSSCCDWVQWRGIGAGLDAAAQAGDLIADDGLCNIGFILPLAGDWEQFRSKLPRNIKEALRKCYNSLARDGHKFQIRVVSAADDAPAALDRFFALHNARASRTDTTSHPDIFDTPAAQAFLRDLCAHKALRGQLRIFELVVAGEVVATRIGFLLGDQLYLYYSGYAPAWGRYSVMTTVVAEAIRWAIEAKCRLVNLSTGADVSKTRWRPQAVSYHGYYEPRSLLHRQTTFKFIQRARRRA